MNNSCSKSQDGEQIRAAVRQFYGAAAEDADQHKRSSCCGGKTEGLSASVKDVISSDLYSAGEIDEIPVAAQLASLGCGNPTALAELRAGEVVLDLGSGGGIDVLLSARRVGSDGFAYGLDMTDEMLALAEKNRLEAGLENVKFLKGQIEEIPLPDASVDVIISNCVINLSADKDRVLREAARVLKPGGRFAVSDIVLEGDADLPERVRENLLAWSGCIAGALSTEEYKRKLTDAGFVDAEIEPTRRYSMHDVQQAGFTCVPEGLSAEEKSALDGRIMSAFVRAVKP